MTKAGPMLFCFLQRFHKYADKMKLALKYVYLCGIIQSIDEGFSDPKREA